MREMDDKCADRKSHQANTHLFRPADCETAIDTTGTPQEPSTPKFDLSVVCMLQRLILNIPIAIRAEELSPSSSHMRTLKLGIVSSSFDYQNGNIGIFCQPTSKHASGSPTTASCQLLSLSSMHCHLPADDVVIRSIVGDTSWCHREADTSWREVNEAEVCANSFRRCLALPINTQEVDHCRHRGTDSRSSEERLI